MASRRPFLWYTSIALAQTVASGGQSNNALLSLLDSGAARGSTITRVIVKLYARSPVNTFQTFHYGLVVVSEDAATAGAFPDTDVASDQANWYVRGFGLASATSTLDHSQYTLIEHDLRGQRILRSADDAFHFVIDQGASGSALTYDLFARVLLKLQ